MPRVHTSLSSLLFRYPTLAHYFIQTDVFIRRRHPSFVIRSRKADKSIFENLFKKKNVVAKTTSVIKIGIVEGRSREGDDVG